MAQARKMFRIKVVPIDIINHSLQYDCKKFGHPVFILLIYKSRIANLPIFTAIPPSTLYSVIQLFSGLIKI